MDEKEKSIRFIKEYFLNCDSSKQKKLQELLKTVIETDKNEIDSNFYSNIIKKVTEL